jgi:sugar phosphate isomerase/epimerase
MLALSETLSRVLVASMVLGMTVASARAQVKISDEQRVGGFAVGCQAYTFNRFSVFEAIEKTDQAGGRIIEFFPGQKLSKEEPNVKFDHNSPEEVIQKVKAKLAKHNVLAVNYGVVQIDSDEAKARKIFDFAKKMGLYGITTEADKSIDTIEKLVKEYDIRVGFHEHASNPSNPGYKVWDPMYVAELVKDRDPRIGACADTGHWATSGLKPLECLQILKGRIISTHLKERATIGKSGPDIVYGTGVSEIGAMLDELKAQGFQGHISIEYENNWDHSVPDVAQCIGFIRGYTAKK